MDRDVHIVSMRLVLFILIFFVNYNLSARASSRQEAAKIEYFNPKYVSSAFAYTGRTRRDRPYVTNVTVTTLVPMNNNVTIRLQHNMKNTAIDFEIVRKSCDIVKISWIHELISKYSNIGHTCPFPAKTYYIFNMELDKDKIKLPIPKGTNEIKVVYEKTDTKETILKISGIMNVFE